MAELEVHDEIVEWMDSLDATEWNRTVVVIDWLVALVALVALGSSARMSFSRNLGDGLFELRFTLGPRLGGPPTGSRRTAGSSSSRPSASNATTNETRSIERAE